MIRSTDRPAMTIAVDLGHKATKQTNKYFRDNSGSEYHERKYLILVKTDENNP